MFQLVLHHIKHLVRNRVLLGRRLVDVIKLVLALGILIWLLKENSVQSNYHWQWRRIFQYFGGTVEGQWRAGPLIQGLMLTLRISAVSMVMAVIFGLSAAIMRLSHNTLIRFWSRCYLEIIRNTPLLVQIFFVYFVLGPILSIDRFWAAVLALSLFEGAYMSEIMRAGIVAIPRDQWEAAYSLGLRLYQIYRRIIIPQAFRRILPPLVSQGVSLIKDSALVSIIAVYELTMQGQVIIAKTFLTFEVWFTIALIYLAITLTLTTLAGVLENRLNMGQ